MRRQYLADVALVDPLPDSAPPLKIIGLRVTINPSMPPGTAEFRDSTGRVVGRIVNIGDEPKARK